MLLNKEVLGKSEDVIRLSGSVIDEPQPELSEAGKALLEASWANMVEHYDLAFRG
jgi:hypothetical protein